jgi:predicted DNA-binding transcriptional regulator YafY
VWAPRTPVTAPDGKQASTIAKARRGPVSPPARTTEPAVSLGEDPVEVVLQAIERGSDVSIVYAGAKGTTQRQITPHEIEGAAVHAYCHLRRDERSFWLASIVDAVPAAA